MDHLEAKNAHAISHLIPPESYASEDYNPIFLQAIKVNNAIYSIVYQYLFIFLALVPGVIISFGMGMTVATFQFLNEFTMKPFLRLIRIFTPVWVLPSQIAYEMCRPIFALIAPWNKH